MKTLNLALIAALTLTSASVMATSTGFKNSVTTGGSSTFSVSASSNTMNSNTINSSSQWLDVGNLNPIHDDITTRVETFDTYEKSNGHGESVTLSVFDDVSSSTSLGAISIRSGVGSGSSVKHGEHYSIYNTEINGVFTETSRYIVDGTSTFSNEHGSFNNNKSGANDTTYNSGTTYDSGYTSVDFDY